MCGIAGFYLREKDSAGNLRRMAGTLAHRGPDGEGFFEEEGVGLGHRRLSIIDLETGGQPIFSEDGSAVVIFNGEIYNYRELRAGLSSRGHDFRTASDTEVLVHLYEERGELFAEELDGIFAFALFDRKKKRLLLGRDQVGVKPLYYALFEGGLLFGSEPKALLSFKGFNPSHDRQAAALYFQMEYFPAPLTPFREMRKLLPGHMLVVSSPGDAAEKKYNFWKFEDLSRASEEEAAAKTREAVLSSVSAQLMSDVPLGVFLSGGVDSACVAAAMKARGADIRSFSIGFEDRDFDESRHAKAAAEHLGTAHSERIFTEKEMLAEVPEILSSMDEPLADPSVFPTAILSKFARRSVTVALGGDGGDELFCGYPTYAIHRLFPLYKASPSLLRKASLSIADKLLPVREGNLTFPYKLRKFMDGAEKEMPERHLAWMGAFNRERLSELMPGGGLDFSPLDWIGPAPQEDRVCRAEWLDMHTYLMEDVLQKVDRMSMLSSLEARVPLLAPSVVQLAFSIPSSMKLRGFTLKRVLKKAFEKELPPGYFDRPKKGFAIPISRWIRGPLAEMVRDELSQESLKSAPFLDGGYVTRILEDHFEGKADNRKLVWTLLIFMKWLRSHGNRP